MFLSSRRLPPKLPPNILASLGFPWLRRGFQHPGRAVFRGVIPSDPKTATGSSICIYPPGMYARHFSVLASDEAMDDQADWPKGNKIRHRDYNYLDSNFNTRVRTRCGDFLTERRSSTPGRRHPNPVAVPGCNHDYRELNSTLRGHDGRA